MKGCLVALLLVVCNMSFGQDYRVSTLIPLGNAQHYEILGQIDGETVVVSYSPKRMDVHLLDTLLETRTSKQLPLDAKQKIEVLEIWLEDGIVNMVLTPNKRVEGMYFVSWDVRQQKIVKQHDIAIGIDTRSTVSSHLLTNKDILFYQFARSKMFCRLVDVESQTVRIDSMVLETTMTSPQLEFVTHDGDLMTMVLKTVKNNANALGIFEINLSNQTYQKNIVDYVNKINWEVEFKDIVGTSDYKGLVTYFDEASAQTFLKGGQRKLDVYSSDGFAALTIEKKLPGTLKCRDIVRATDGSDYVIFESYEYEERRSQIQISNFPNPVYEYRPDKYYTYGPLLRLSISEDLKVEEEVLFFKQQEVVNDNFIYASVGFYVSPEKHVTVHNVLNDDGNMLQLHAIGTNFEVSNKSLFVNEFKNLYLQPRYAKQFESGALLIPAFRKEGLYLVKIDE